MDGDELDWDVGVTDEERAALASLGWSEIRLATLSDLGPADTLELVEKLRKSPGLEALDGAAFASMVEDLADGLKETWRIEARQPDADLLVASRKAILEKRRKLNEEQVSANLAKSLPKKGKATRIRLPTRLARKQALAGEDLNLRELAERQERSRWLGELKQIIARSGMPAGENKLAGDLSDSRFAKGRRASTLRKHVKTWNVAARWFKGTFNVAWPRHPHDVVAYMEARLTEPCSRTSLDSFYRTLMFLEFAGEVPDGERLSEHGSLKNMLEEAKLQLESVALKEKRQAKLMPVMLIASMERLVTDEAASNYVRAYCWYRLVKVWSGMRFNDTQGVPASSMCLSGEGLTGEIHKSKTSGAGKKLGILHFHVSKHAWLRDSNWLKTGWNLWKRMETEAHLEGRDFFLPAPNSDESGFMRRMVSYALASAISQAVFTQLWVAHRGRKVSLLFEGVGTAWTEHSERATLRTWSQGSGVPEDVRRQLGRWRPSIDEGYERNTKANVLRSHRVIAEFIKMNTGREDPFDEEAVLRFIGKKMQEMGHPDECVQEQMEQLRTFAEPGGWVDAPLRVRWAMEGPIGVRLGNDDAVPSNADDDDWNEDEDDRLKQDDAEKLRGLFVCSIVGRSSTKTLHKVGECHRLPGIHYHRFEVLGEDVPCTSKYHKTCSICFPDDSKLISVEDTDSSEGVSSSDSSSSEGEAAETG